jgi:dynein heavy chain 1
VTLFVTEIQDLNRSLVTWQAELDRAKSGYKLLLGQRYIFPADWLSLDILEGEWTAFRQILSRKSKVMEDQIPSL